MFSRMCYWGGNPDDHSCPDFSMSTQFFRADFRHDLAAAWRTFTQFWNEQNLFRGCKVRGRNVENFCAKIGRFALRERTIFQNLVLSRFSITGWSLQANLTFGEPDPARKSLWGSFTPGKSTSRFPFELQSRDIFIRDIISSSEWFRYSQQWCSRSLTNCWLLSDPGYGNYFDVWTLSETNSTVQRLLFMQTNLDFRQGGGGSYFL